MSSSEAQQNKGQYAASYSYSSYSQVNDEPPVIEGERAAIEGDIDQDGQFHMTNSSREKYDPSRRLASSSAEQKALEDKRDASR